MSEPGQTATQSAKVDAYLPLKPSAFLILLTLSAGESHGYRIMREVEEQSQGRIRLQAGALYRLLKRLLGDGLIEECDRRPAADQDDERRRYYAISDLGRLVAAAEAKRMAQMVEAAQSSRLIDDPLRS